MIDFRRGIGLFTELDPHRLARLERMTSNHLAFDLTRDIYDDPVEDEEANRIRQLLAMSGPAATAE